MDPFRVLGQVGLGSESPPPSPWRERRAAVMSTHGCSLEACFLRAIGFPLWGLFLGANGNKREATRRAPGKARARGS